MKQSILAVLLESPWPSNSGITRRLNAIASTLAADVDLSILIAAHAPPLQQPDLRISFALRSPSKVASALRVVPALATGRPLVTAFYRRASVTRSIRAAIRATTPDLVFTHGVAGLALVERHVPLARVVVDLADYEPHRVASISAEATGTRRWRWTLDARRVGSYLEERLPHCRGVSTVSEEDASRYAALAPGVRVVVAGNGVSAPREPRPDPGGATFLFLGDLRYLPNAAALEWFVSHVIDRTPAIDQLRVVGRGDAVIHPRVSSAGWVERLEPEWANAVASVVPVRSGGGTRLKVLESFAAGVPVVSTPLGVSGLSARAGHHYLEANSPEEFSSACTQLASDYALRNRLQHAGRELVARMSWDTTLQPLRTICSGAMT